MSISKVFVVISRRTSVKWAAATKSNPSGSSLARIIVQMASSLSIGRMFYKKVPSVRFRQHRHLTRAKTSVTQVYYLKCAKVNSHSKG
jgi:hypothetical protein